MTSVKSDWVPVKTTLPAQPLPPNSSRAQVVTERLLIRALVPEDLQGLHAMRAQPEVMINNPQGRADKDLEETRPRLAAYLPPHDTATFQFAICLKDSPRDMIGIGGCHRLASIYGWPAVGYMLREEFWGQGLATEFLRAWLGMWARLPRAEAEIHVDPRTLAGGGGRDGPVPEQVTSFTVADNVASHRVLTKCGFECFLTQREPDLRNPEVEVELRGYRWLCG